MKHERGVQNIGVVLQSDLDCSLQYIKLAYRSVPHIMTPCRYKICSLFVIISQNGRRTMNLERHQIFDDNHQSPCLRRK